MDIRVYDVEHGDCVLIISARNEAVLVDCGYNGTTGWRPSEGLAKQGFGTRRQLHHVIITHPDQDHLTGFPGVLDTINPLHVWQHPQLSLKSLCELKDTLSLAQQVYLSRNKTVSELQPLEASRQFKTMELRQFYLPLGSVRDVNDLSLVSFITENGFTVCLLTKIEDKYGNALKIVRVQSNSKPTVKIDHVDIRYYDVSGSSWTDKQIMLFRYVSGTNRVETITLLDTSDGGGTPKYVYLYYTYSSGLLANVYLLEDTLANIASTPSGGTDLLATVGYTYSNGLLEYVYDSIAMCVPSPPTANSDSWYITYSGGSPNKVASVRYRNADGAAGGNNTATTSYDYDVTSGLPFTKLNANDKVTKLTDGEGRYWWYEHESESAPNDWKNGRVVRTADPLYDDSTNQNDVQYTWNGDHNLTEVKTWEPNAGANQISTKYYYNSDKNLEVVQDALGFLTFYKYDTANSKPNNLIETYTQQSGQIVTTVAPASPDISDVLTDVDGYYYDDGTTPTAQKIRLVKTTMTYTANDDLATVVTPLGSTTTYNYDSTTGDMTWVKDPMQTNDANLGRTDYAYDETYGVVLTVTNALSEVTTYTYDAACVRRTKVELPKGASYYTSYVYDRRFYLTSVVRPDPATGTTPEVTLTSNTYDYNGNVTDVAIPDVWNSGSFTSKQFVYDRLNRLTESKVNVNLQDGGGRQYLTTKYGYDRVNNRLWAKDPDDYVSLTDYDDANRAVKSYQPFQDANAPSGTPPTYSPPGGTPYAEFTLDKVGNTVIATDMNGNDTDYTYDNLSRAVQVDQDFTDYTTTPPSADSVTTKTVFDSAGLTYNTENGRGKKMYFIYDDDGRKVKNVRLDRTTGDYDETEYNLNGAVYKYYDYESVADSKSYWTQYEYDKLNRTVNVMDNEGNWMVADTEFDANGNVDKRYDRVNASGTYYTVNSYDYWDRLTQVEFPQVKNVNGLNIKYCEQYAYNVLGMRETVQDRNGQTTAYEYDEMGRAILVTLPGGTYTTSTFYTNRGFVDYTIGTTGAYTRYTYDAAGRRTQVELDHDSGTLDDTDYTYDDNGNVTQIDYPDGGQTKYYYDELNRRYKQEVLRTSPSTYITTEYGYSKTNKVTLIKHPTGYDTTYTYTDLDQVDTVTAPGSFQTSYDYDLQNRTVSVTDPDGLVTEYEYNTNSWTTKVTNKVDTTPANDIVVEYGYDDNGARTSEKDPLGNQYDREYDAMGRNTKITAPLVTGQVSSKEDLRYFDGNGNVVKVVDFKAQVTNYRYNALNQRSSMGWGASSTDVQYTWNCCRVTAYTDATGSASLGYDQLARLLSFTDTQGNQVQYDYDSMSRVLVLTDHTSSTTTYTYDKRGGVTQITTPSGNTDYTHDSAGRVDTRTYANNLKSSYTYDTAGRVSQMKFEDNTQVPPALIEQYDYSYTGLAAAYARTETNAAARYSYTFDKLRRMTNETKRGTGGGLPLHYQKDFTYDKAGNRATYQHQNGAGYNYGQAVNYNSHTYDEMGRLTQIADTVRRFTATVTSDWNGNITSVQEVIPGGMNVTSTFTYDYENRLTEYAVGGTNFSVEHTYDGFNRLVKTDATIGANTQNFKHVYAGRLHLGNIETTGVPVVGKVWKWEAGAGMPHAGPIESPQRYTASATQFYMVSDERNVERKSYRVASITAGDYNDDSLYAEWQQVNGNAIPTRPALMAYKSELFSAYQVTLDADRASSAATNHALQLAASDLEYEGTRVKSPVLGRDLNPMGRGDGAYYADGGNAAPGASVSITGAKPVILGEVSSGFGSSVNNLTGAGGGGPCQQGEIWKKNDWCCCITSCVGPSPVGYKAGQNCCETLKSSCKGYVTFPFLSQNRLDEEADRKMCESTLWANPWFSCAYNSSEHAVACDEKGSGSDRMNKEEYTNTLSLAMGSVYYDIWKDLYAQLTTGMSYNTNLIKSQCAKDQFDAAIKNTDVVATMWNSEDDWGVKKTVIFAETLCGERGVNNIIIIDLLALLLDTRKDNTWFNYYKAWRASGLDSISYILLQAGGMAGLRKLVLDTLSEEYWHAAWACNADCDHHIALVNKCLDDMGIDHKKSHTLTQDNKPTPPPVDSIGIHCECCACVHPTLRRKECEGSDIEGW